MGWGPPRTPDCAIRPILSREIERRKVVLFTHCFELLNLSYSDEKLTINHYRMDFDGDLQVYLDSSKLWVVTWAQMVLISFSDQPPSVVPSSALDVSEIYRQIRFLKAGDTYSPHVKPKEWKPVYDKFVSLSFDEFQVFLDSSSLRIVSWATMVLLSFSEV